MRRRVSVLAMFVVGLSASVAVGLGQSAGGAKADRWQKYLDNKEFDFRKEETGLYYALPLYDGDCQIHMVPTEQLSLAFEFRFVRNGKTMATVRGMEHTTFLHAENIVYFALNHRYSVGGLVAAYDLEAGKRLWITLLRAIGGTARVGRHYRNEVNLRLHDGVVHIVGHEKGGDYEEIFDQKTGRRLAYRVFRGHPPPAELPFYTPEYAGEYLKKLEKR